MKMFTIFLKKLEFNQQYTKVIITIPNFFVFTELNKYFLLIFDSSCSKADYLLRVNPLLNQVESFLGGR